MTERNTFVDVVNGDQLNQGYFNGIRPAHFKQLNQDQTAASVSSTTVENEIGEVAIPANTVTTGVLVFATGTFRSDGVSVTNTATLRAGTSTTATANAAIKTTTGYSPSASQWGWAMVYYISTLTWTSDNYVQITGTPGRSDANCIVQCDSIEVIYL